MGKFIDISGQRFGRLTAISPTKIPNDTRAYWRCACDCGQTAEVSGKSLRSGGTLSCDCLSCEWSASMGANQQFIKARAAKMTKHGHKAGRRPSPEYRIWLGIKRRCSDTKSKDYENWGGRGIKVCPEWDSSFEASLEDMGPKPSPAHQIDRKDSNKGYEPDNCRWVTPTVQGAENRRAITPISVDGLEFPSIAADARHFGVGKTTVLGRVQRGMALKDAVKFKAWGKKPRRSRESYLPKDHPDRR